LRGGGERERGDGRRLRKKSSRVLPLSHYISLMLFKRRRGKGIELLIFAAAERRPSAKAYVQEGKKARRWI